MFVEWQPSLQVSSATAAQAGRILVAGSFMGLSIICKNISHTLFRGIVWSQESMKDVDPRSSLWEMKSPHSWVSPLVGERLKRGNSESIGQYAP